MNKQRTYPAAIDKVGGFRAIAEICGVHESTARRWKHGVPVKYHRLLMDHAGAKGRRLTLQDMFLGGGVI